MVIPLSVLIHQAQGNPPVRSPCGSSRPTRHNVCHTEELGLAGLPEFGPSPHRLPRKRLVVAGTRSDDHNRPPRFGRGSLGARRAPVAALPRDFRGPRYASDLTSRGSVQQAPGSWSSAVEACPGERCHPPTTAGRWSYPAVVASTYTRCDALGLDALVPKNVARTRQAPTAGGVNRTFEPGLTSHDWR